MKPITIKYKYRSILIIDSLAYHLGSLFPFRRMGSEYFKKKISWLLTTRLTMQEGQSQSWPPAGQHLATLPSSPWQSLEHEDCQFSLFSILCVLVIAGWPVDYLGAALLFALSDYSGPISSKLWVWWLLRSPPGQENCQVLITLNTNFNFNLP